MTRQLLTLSAAVALLCSCAATTMEDTKLPVNEITPPAVPLVTVDPYFSVWSMTDQVNASRTKHWTGNDKPIVSAVRVDGKVYRLVGQSEKKTEVILPTIGFGQWEARYLIDKAPKGDWTAQNYDDSDWETAPGAFGTRGNPGVKTYWGDIGSEIWVRRSIKLDKDLCYDDLLLEYSHDDCFELYIDGVKLVDTGFKWQNNLTLQVPDDVKDFLFEGSTLTIAAHCLNKAGGAYVDFGLFKLDKTAPYDNVAIQKSCNVLPTRTIYSFECGGIDLNLIFTAPLLMDDLDLLSRPVNYVTWEAKSNDGQKHDVQVCLEGTPHMAVHFTSQAVTASTGTENGIQFAKTGTTSQKVLGKRGDNVRIDWGYFYVAAPAGQGQTGMGNLYDAEQAFAEGGTAIQSDQVLFRDNVPADPIALQYVCDLGSVGNSVVSRFAMLAYDDIYSIQYFGENLRPWWNRKGEKTFEGELAAAAAQYPKIMKRCDAFDKSLMADAIAAGGKKYAELCALAYRQSIAAHKLVESPQGDLLFLSKENFSNGSIGTVDVTYPSEPLYLLYNTDLAKGLLNHIFYYSESGKWAKPFAAHDVGTYPHANGQTYGGDMPVEESGNMIVLTGAISVIDGNADYAAKHWETLTQWCKYLVDFGQDPEYQLCTDDFAGRSAHNTNLSIKAIEGIAAYATMAGMLGKNDVHDEYMALAKKMAAIWKQTAADGDHYRLGFDREGSWSQKYNLVWDKLLGFNVFDEDIAKTEIAWYKKVQNEYGLPLDCRSEYTKTDWILWSATMAENQEDFECLVDKVWKFMDETEDRVPMSDWVHTDRPVHVGFQARSVVGGYFIRLLDWKLNKK